ncbi:retron St85 family RNA-directed DNA polymerase [Vibrio gallaecicus]|uniref:retron St85 family RNA-directed DNA polymerase n=1 Tax=Vibrio gallaecicus TaxID=552386 RepID=UPI0010C9741A|nr:retron St85 family RNA-directed DNA polymerase [Vibrio gallaecicus]MDN3617369.1 retron St85 family RNA-directed DNA polymerase [Vibrio gallaecicus]
MNLLQRLSIELGVSESHILSITASGPLKYKVYSIPKRTHGRRIIAHPSKDLKKLQKSFIKLHNFPIHTNAMAYKEGVSIKDNASFHKSNKYLLKMDFENFFNSITPVLFWNVWNQHFPKSSYFDKKIIENILFWAPNIHERERLILSVGAPSSPMISNFCLFQFDSILTHYCIERSIFFTRYADDLTFSTDTPDLLKTLPGVISNLLRQLYEGQIEINNQKTVFSSQAHNKHVTGITITPEGKLSIGRSRKRYIKHLVHQYILNKLKSSDFNHLRGLLTFSMHIEPQFITSLENKYSTNIIENIVRGINEQN